MCFRSIGAAASRRRSLPRRQAPALPPLAMLDLSKLGERRAHDFLRRATRKRHGMWKLISLRRRGDVLLCVVRWVHPDNRAKPFSLAELSLTEIAVYWREFASHGAAQTALERRARSC